MLPGHTFADVAIIGAAPFASLGHVKALYAEGVRGVINLCDEYRGPTEEYSNLGMKQLYLPTGNNACQSGSIACVRWRSQTLLVRKYGCR